MTRRLRALLLSNYDLGHSPFGLASPAAWLREAGHTVTMCDRSVDPLDEIATRVADLIALYLPMHTATRLALRELPRLRQLAPRAHIVAYGLYASPHRQRLQAEGADSVVSGEYEAELVALAERIATSDDPRAVAPPRPVSVERLRFRVPDRRGLPELERHAHVHMHDGAMRVAGYTEASRGCKHRCRHCPIVPIYGGHFRVVPRTIVLQDVRRQVDAGARHITFGDPDFWNGIGHAMPLVRALHDAHPDLSYDVTIKIEHLLQHAEHLAELVATGCLFVTSAVEAVDDAILARLDKGHTRADFERAVALCRRAGLILHPTFVAFTPWTTAVGCREMLEVLETLELEEHVAPIQLALRLLVTAESRLLALEEVRSLVGPFSPEALVHPWRHPHPEIDRMQEEAFAIAAHARSRVSAFDELRALADRYVSTTRDATWGTKSARHAASASDRSRIAASASHRRVPVPYLSEPWYC